MQRRVINLFVRNIIRYRREFVVVVVVVVVKVIS